MPPREKTPAEKAAEKARILEAALDIRACDGYEGLTMRKLGQKIGASATKIYLYFVNKDEVYLSVVIEGYRQLCASLRAAMAGCEGGEERFDRFLRAYLAFAWSHPTFYEVMALRKIPMHADYAGTPMEAAARQKYEAGMEVFLLTRKVLEGYLEEKGVLSKLEICDIGMSFTRIIPGYNGLTESMGTESTQWITKINTLADTKGNALLFAQTKSQLQGLGYTGQIQQGAYSKVSDILNQMNAARGGTASNQRSLAFANTDFWSERNWTVSSLMGDLSSFQLAIDRVKSECIQSV